MAKSNLIMSAVLLQLGLHCWVATALQVGSHVEREAGIKQPANVTGILPGGLGTAKVQAHAPVCSQNRVALMVSGQSYRFLYKDMFEKIGNVSDFFGCTVDLYVVLSSQHGIQWKNTTISTPYANDVLENKQAVSTFLKKHGFNQVSIEVMSKAEAEASQTNLLEGVMEKGGGPVWFERMKSIADYSKRFPANSRMLDLRNKVYSFARSSESNNSYCYSHFMYVRDDDVFQGKPAISLGLIAPRGAPSIAASKFCGFGHTCDKIYFGNRQGFDVLFGEHRQALTTQLVDYLHISSVRNQSKVFRSEGEYPMTTEFFTEWHMKRNGVNILPVDFSFNNVRYSPKPCILELYRQCATRNVFPTCDH